MVGRRVDYDDLQNAFQAVALSHSFEDPLLTSVLFYKDRCIYHKDKDCMKVAMDLSNYGLFLVYRNAYETDCSFRQRVLNHSSEFIQGLLGGSFSVIPGGSDIPKRRRKPGRIGGVDNYLFKIFPTPEFEEGLKAFRDTGKKPEELEGYFNRVVDVQGFKP